MARRRVRPLVVAAVGLALMLVVGAAAFLVVASDPQGTRAQVEGALQKAPVRGTGWFAPFKPFVKEMYQNLLGRKQQPAPQPPSAPSPAKDTRTPPPRAPER